MESINNPSVIVIFGFTGDLAKRKVLPSLLHLEIDNLLGPELKILGITRRDTSINDIQELLKGHVKNCRDDCSDENLDKFLSRIKILRMQMTDINDYQKLSQSLTDIDEAALVAHNRLYYLAIPQSLLKTVTKGLVNCQPKDKNIQARLLIEKPFGSDLSSSKELVSLLDSNFTEEQIFRIDHYLAKETAQNLLYFRFHNPLVQNIWNPEFINEIHITVAEEIGIEGRVNFYESTGALRDMIQSHALQLLALTIMDDPLSLDSASIRANRLKALKSLVPMDSKKVATDTVRGQYQEYKKEVGNPDSNTETYVALRACVRDSIWKDTPIYIRSGKALAEKITEIVLVFNDPAKHEQPDNLLSIRIQPNEGIGIELTTKKPGLLDEHQKVVMDYRYKESGHEIKHTAYEKLIIDALNGDQTLFPSSDEVLASWEFIEPILKLWSKGAEDLKTYEPGSWGPSDAEQLLSDNDSSWRLL